MSSRGVNKVILIGRVGQDPEMRFMPNGTAVANLTLATSEQWRDKQTGENKENTEWHRVVLFGKVAEVAGEYVKKGSQLYIEGQLRTRKWQAQDGTDKYTTEIVVNVGGQMQMIGNRPAGDNQAAGSGQNGSQNGWGQPQQPTHSGPQGGGYDKSRAGSNSAPPAGNEPPMDFDDDIPF